MKKMIIEQPDDSITGMKIDRNAGSPILKFFLFMLMSTGLLTEYPVLASDGSGANLVTAGWLEKNLNNSDVIILDASPARIYAAKHIPGAISVDIYTWYGLSEMPIAGMERTYQSWGISPGKRIVMYDQGGTIMATRLFYSLYYHGFPLKDLLILDGGLFKWEEAGLPVTKDIPAVSRKGSFVIRKINDEIKADLGEFVTASGDIANNVLVEALGPDWHFGEMMPFNRPGHVPNAIMMPPSDFFNPDKTFKPVEEIKKMLDYMNIAPEQTVFTHCGGGVAASVPFFALKFLAGYPNVKLYRESQLGWLSDERGLPFWTYDEPFLVRETAWLQFRGGRMLRMYGGSQVSIVDVRSSDEFYSGHIPFAVNIPADNFRSNIKEPGRLAAKLDRSGIDPSHEAVVVSGGGLTRDAALAFLMLRNLGQKKVSVYIEPLNKWTSPASTLTTDSTSVGQRKTTGLDLASVPYPADIRNDVIISDLRSNTGIYPRVLVASGSSVPSGVRDGTVVHIPFSMLLSADGKPKEAKDIWNILAKAGIPRYAEIICFSDDTGEAAINYVIFKLMGFPDVKVLVI